MTASKRRLPGALLLSLVFATAAAHAQPSAAQKETARGLMAEGRALREQGDLEGALKRFSAADSIMGVPTTGFEVAATQAQLGRMVEARETLRRLMAIAPSADDPEPFNDARSKARALEQQLLAHLGTLRFEVRGVERSDALEVLVDGEVVPKAALDQPYRVNPGRHAIVARAGTREVKREVEAVDARAVDVELRFEREAARTSEPAPATREPAQPPVTALGSKQPASRAWPTLAYVGGGLGAAGLLVGTVSGIAAISHKNAAKQGCVNGGCPPSTWSDLDSARSLATGSTVAFVVGAIGLVVGVGAVLVGSAPRPTQRALLVSPDVGPQGARLSVSGRF